MKFNLDSKTLRMMAKPAHHSANAKVFHSLHLLVTIACLAVICFNLYSLSRMQFALESLKQTCVTCNLRKCENESSSPSVPCTQNKEDFNEKQNEERKKRATVLSTQTCEQRIRYLIEILKESNRLVS